MHDHNVKFLLADDDSDDSDLFREALREAAPFATCYVVSDGSEVLEKLDSGVAGMPDVIFLDINMPDVNGWECLRTLKQTPAYAEIPVIMYSTSSSLRDINAAKTLGALGLFTKPDRFTELKEFLRVVVECIKAGAYSKLKASTINFYVGRLG